MMKKFLMLVFIMILSLGLVACATDTPDEDPIDENPVDESPIEDDEVDENEDDTNDVDPMEDEEVNNEDEAVDPEPESEPEPETEGDVETVTLHFASRDFMVDGDETAEAMLTEEREVEYEDASLAEAVVDELIAGPEDIDTMVTVIPDQVTLLGVEVEDGTAFVDFSSENLTGGSLQETLTVNQIVNTLIQLDDVERVQFLIDGEKAETLMGHLEISEPFETTLE